MKITSESQILLDYLKKDINYIKPKKSTINFLSFIYDNFSEFNMNNTNKINYSQIRKFVSEKPRYLSHNSYISSHIVDYINKNILYHLNYTFFLSDRKIAVNYYLFNKSDVNFKYLDEHTNLVCMILDLLQKTARVSCNKTLQIDIYLSPFKRTLPKNNDIIGPVNLNGGFTQTCMKNGHIVVYRKQEWLKVLIHECFHSYGLDYSTMYQVSLNKKLKSLFPIESEFNLYETYSELWAEILNTCLIAYFFNKDSFDDFVKYFSVLIEKERDYSFFQIAKILDYQNLTYRDLFKKDNSFKENTNVFAYYIAKAILYYNYESFIEWCAKNNNDYLNFTKTYDSLDSFYKLLKKGAKNKNLISFINSAQRELEKNAKNQNWNFIKNNLRMTCLEI